jgi:hypothetical protein
VVEVSVTSLNTITKKMLRQIARRTCSSTTATTYQYTPSTFYNRYSASLFQQRLHQQQQVRSYAAEAEEEEIDEDEKARREKIAKLEKPVLLPGMVPRIRSMM